MLGIAVIVIAISLSATHSDDSITCNKNKTPAVVLTTFCS